MGAVSAGIYIGNGDIEISNSDADAYTDLSAKSTTKAKIYSLESKKKIPTKYKKYENYTFKVAKGSKIYYKAITRSSNGVVTNISGLKIKKATVSFGDGTKKIGNKWISHKYKKSGWYLIKVNLNATFTKGYLYGMDLPGNVVNGTRIYLVYVENNPQLSISKVTSGYNTITNYKKKNIDYLDIKVINIGSKTSKATKIKIWYQKPGAKNFGKVYSKLKKYTASAKLKALKPGKSTTVRIFFKIPKKYLKLVKNIRLDSLYRVREISRANTLYSFK